MFEFIQNWLINQGLEITMADMLTRIIAGILTVGLSILADFVTRRFILKGLTFSIGRTGTRWDDIILDQNVFNWLAHLAPALVIYPMIPVIFKGYPQTIAVATNIIYIYVIVIGVLAVDALLSAVLQIYQTFETSREIPLKGFIQVLKLVTYFLGGIIVVSIIIDRTPFFLLSGLGAMTAVLMLIFKDAILGFVAGIQLTANKMLARGDWIEMPKYDADGDVLDITLTTVKVQNWDKTITTIPTYALISESFKNWRGMSEAGGRRIKRSINIDMNTIKFCDEEMLERYSRIEYITEYIERKTEEIAEYNAAQQIDEASPVNGRRLTNIGTFRAYVTAYLKNHPMIHQEMTFLVRQLSPTIQGLPIEIYVFSKDKVWANYEGLQADIFDHLLAIVPEFDLRVFQNPTGSDFTALLEP